MIALYDRGKKVSKFKWRCYTPEALVAEQTAYDTAKKSPNYYTRQALAKVYVAGMIWDCYSCIVQIRYACFELR